MTLKVGETSRGDVRVSLGRENGAKLEAVTSTNPLHFVQLLRVESRFFEDINV